MSTVIAGVVLAVGSAALLAVSWRSLGHPRSHGFFRFFAFEAILCLVVLNAPHWFERPAAPLKLLSWMLLAVGSLLAIHGFHLLHRRGAPTAPGPGSALFRVEHTSALVTVGAYRYIRHPLYASLLLGAWGIVLKAPSPLAVGLGLIASAFVVATAKAEEAENLERFGAAYRAYMARTRLFIPLLL